MIKHKFIIFIKVYLLSCGALLCFFVNGPFGGKFAWEMSLGVCLLISSLSAYIFFFYSSVVYSYKKGRREGAEGQKGYHLRVLLDYWVIILMMYNPCLGLLLLFYDLQLMGDIIYTISASCFHNMLKATADLDGDCIG